MSRLVPPCAATLQPRRLFPLEEHLGEGWSEGQRRWLNADRFHTHARHGERSEAIQQQRSSPPPLLDRHGLRPRDDSRKLNRQTHPTLAMTANTHPPSWRAQRSHPAAALKSTAAA